MARSSQWNQIVRELYGQLVSYDVSLHYVFQLPLHVDPDDRASLVDAQNAISLNYFKAGADDQISGVSWSIIQSTYKRLAQIVRLDLSKPLKMRSR